MTRRRRRTIPGRIKQNASGAERKDTLCATVITRRTVVKTAARRKKRRSAHTWRSMSRFRNMLSSIVMKQDHFTTSLAGKWFLFLHRSNWSIIIGSDLS